MTGVLTRRSLGRRHSGKTMCGHRERQPSTHRGEQTRERISTSLHEGHPSLYVSSMSHWKGWKRTWAPKTPPVSHARVLLGNGAPALKVTFLLLLHEVV